MGTRQLYNIRIPQDTQTNSSRQGLGHELESLSGLDSDQPVIEALGVQSGDHSINASYSHAYAEKVAAELEELFAASGFQHLPYYTPSDPGRSGDSYVVLENGSVETASQHDDRVQVVSGSFTPSGTRASHRRSLRVNTAQVHRNDFGNATDCLVGIPSAANKRVWYHRETQSREPVTVAQTVEGELANVDLVDATQVSLGTGGGPIDLVYDAPYDVEYQAGVVLWDTRGNASREDLEGRVQWQKCYRTNHEFSGTAVVDTGRLRVRLDEQNGITAETYDSANTRWTQVGLPTSDWQLRDVDILGVEPQRVQAQLEFEHPSEPTRALNLVARRGHDVVQLLVPESVNSPVPDSLKSYLQDVADDSVVRPQSSLGLLSREEIRR